MSASCRELTGLARPAATGPQLRRSRNELCFWPLEPGQPERRKKLLGLGVTVVAAVSEELPRLASAAGNGTAVAGRPAPRMSASCRELTGLARPAATGPQLRRSRNELCFWPLEPRQPERRKKLPGRGVTVVAAVSEELPRLASAAGNGTAVAGRLAPPGKVAVQAALTVRRKHKKDLKEAVAGHLDALWDMVGWGVMLELISTKIHPSGERTGGPHLSAKDRLQIGDVTKLNVLPEEFRDCSQELDLRKLGILKAGKHINNVISNQTVPSV